MKIWICFISAVVMLSSGAGAEEKKVQPGTQDKLKAQEFIKKSMQNGDKVQVDSILASVNGAPISLMDVLYESQRTEARLAMVYKGSQLYEEVLKLRKQILDDIISRKLVLNEYKKKPFEVPPQYTETLLDELMENYGCSTREELAAKAKEAGTTLAELKEKAEDKVIIQIMINSFYFSKVNLTPRELYEYYQKNIKDFSSPPQVELQLLFLRNDKKDLQKLLESISADLKSGNSKIFHSLVVLHSDGPNAGQGGDVGWIEKSRLRPEFAKALDKLEKGKIVGPVKTDEGIYFLRLKDVQAGVTDSFRKVLPDLQKKIEEKMRRKAFNEYIVGLKEHAVIRYYF